MEENTTKLIEQLANKLGTTSEYLWGVLIKQAPISAYIDMCYMVSMVVIGWILFKVHKYLAKEDDNRDSLYEKSDGFFIAVMAIFAIFWLICSVACFFSIGNMVTAFLNPEYWALDRILNTIKN